MSGFDRKIRRQQQRHHQKQVQKDIDEKMELYNALEDKCLVCETIFDKTNKKMIEEWYVVVREHPEHVNLYCPSCWDDAIKQLERLKGEEEKNKNA